MQKPIREFYVVGHKSPDSDSICSAIAYTYYLNKKGNKATACRTGDINKETEFILDRFKFEKPKFLKSAKGKNLILVDHNEKEQSPDDIDEANLVQIIDHHKVNFSHAKPISFYIEPIGSTASIIAKQFLKDPNVKLTKEIAGLLLSAILSDTVIFRSPTTTREDIIIAKTLAEEADIENIEDFGIEIKKAKSSLKGQKIKDIILGDFKENKFGKKIIGCGQVEVCDLKEVEEKEEDLKKEIEKIAKERDYDLLVFLATDIIQRGSKVLFWEKEDYMEKTFNKKPENNSFYLEGVMSRKKQIIPPLTKTFEK
jgi:manganese-dependent inorganic pyrophosphatase